MPDTFFRSRPWVAAFSAATWLSLAPLTATAAPTFQLHATANTSSNASTGPDVSNIMTDPPLHGGDFYDAPSGTNGSLFYHTYGTTYGGLTYFGARVSGDGSFYGQTGVSYTDSYTNLSGAAQNVTFSFNVDIGQADVSGTGTGYADLLLRLAFNGGVVASSHTRVDSAATPICSTGGVGVLAGYMSCGAGGASGLGGTYSASVLVNAGDSLVIDYDILSEVAGTFTPGTGAVYCSQGPSRNTDGQAQPGTGGEICGNFNAIARSGDPAGISPGSGYTSASFQVAASAAVPEPGTLALTGLALGGLVLSRRQFAPQPVASS